MKKNASDAIRQELAITTMTIDIAISHVKISFFCFFGAFFI